MILFIDTADLGEIERWLASGVGDGVTTNPTLLKKAGFKEPVEAWRKIICLIQKYSGDSLPLSVEVFRDDPKGMLEQATEFVSVLGYAGTTVKIPIQAADGTDRLRVIRVLSEGRIAVNCTACMHWFQAFAAAKAGARFVSLLYRRSIDAGLDGQDMIRRTRALLDEHGLGAKIIVGSIRQTRDVFDVYEAGAHVVTVPPQFFPQLLHQPKSVDTQIQFLTDAGVEIK